MTSLPTTYTPLESLLLFQALRVSGVESNSFTRISDELKSVPLVKDDPSYDAARLSPDALRQLFLDLLKDEAKRDLEKQVNGANTNGHVSPTSRKRKAPSPKLPSVHEAVQHTHLIPQLIMRLYTRYRDITISQVYEQEKKYDVAVREMDEIRAGKWDESLQKRAAAANVATTASAQTSPKMSVSSLIQPENISPKQANAPNQPRPLSQARIDAVINHDPINDQAVHRRASSGTVLPSLSEIAPHSSHYGIPSKITAGHAFQPSPPTAHSAAYPPSHAQHVGSPQLHHASISVSASPRPILPPPPGMPASPLPGSPGVSPQASHNQTRMPVNLTQQQDNPGHGRQYQPAQPPHLPNSQTYYQQPSQQQQQQPPDRRTSYPYSQQQTPAVRQAGYLPPPFQHAPYQQAQNPQHGYLHQQFPAQYQEQYTPKAPATGPRPQPMQRVVMSDVLRALATPPRPLLRRPVWKVEKRPLPGEAPGSPKRPVVEPLSPILARAPSPVRRTQSTRTRKQNRESSITASDIDDSTRRTRSMSIGSTVNAVEDNPTRRRVKPEQSTSFIADSEEPEATPAPSMLTRKRRGTLTQPASTKRRRQYSTEDLNEEPPPRPTTVHATRNFAKMSTVIMHEIISHKHGSRFAQPVRDKDADGYSSFVKRPQDLKSIRAAITNGARAITAATELSSAPPTPGGSKAQDNVVELDRTIDLVPPKAIVDGAQLEREIMRMFANAVMFNPGEDGMVADTREMFEDVEAKIAEWRGAERDLGTAVAEDEDESRAKRRKL